MKHIVIGYVFYPALSEVTPEDARKLTHINLAFGLIKDGLLDMRNLTDWDRIDNFKRWNPDLKLVLSVGGWGAGEYFVEGSQMDKVSEIVDYVQLMTYDLRNGFTSQAGHHASLGLSKGDTSNTGTRGIVEMFRRAGVPYEKMVVGAAFYSRMFTGVPDINNGLLQPSESVGMAGPGYGELTDQYRLAGGFREYWDDEAEASYLWNGSTFLSYESPEAIRRKCRYVMEKGMMGIMFWEHGCDLTRELLDTIHETIHA